MFESNVETKKRGLLKIIGSLVSAIVLSLAVGYLPATFLIAVYQYQKAQSWEVARCEVECESRSRVHRPRNSYGSKVIRWADVFYDVKAEPVQDIDYFNKLLERPMPVTERSYSIYHVGGWEYWGSFGVDDFCEMDRRQIRNKGQAFEVECYVDPANRDQVALYRGFDLGWILPPLLLLGFGGLIFWVYLLKHDIQKLVKGR